MMIIENKFNFGDIVYLKTDPDQRARIVTTFSVGGSLNAIRAVLRDNNIVAS
jgi:hypothetical protein